MPPACLNACLNVGMCLFIPTVFVCHIKKLKSLKIKIL